MDVAGEARAHEGRHRINYDSIGLKFIDIAVHGREMGLQVNPGQVARLIFVASPTSVTSGSGFYLYAEALDAYGNLTSFSDTVHFSSSDPNATLPSDETYPGNNRNLGSFILRTKGTQTITMTDVNDPSLFSTITIQVT